MSDILGITSTIGGDRKVDVREFIILFLMNSQEHHTAQEILVMIRDLEESIHQRGNGSVALAVDMQQLETILAELVDRFCIVFRRQYGSKTYQLTERGRAMIEEWRQMAVDGFAREHLLS